MRYLLDANAVIDALNDPSSAVSRRLRRESPADIAISAVVAHELYYGAFKSARAERNVALVDALRFDVLPFDREDARKAGEVRAVLASGGRPIGPYDVLIAGQALSRQVTLVTRNVAEFSRIAGLAMEDWSA